MRTYTVKCECCGKAIGCITGGILDRCPDCWWYMKCAVQDIRPDITVLCKDCGGDYDDESEDVSGSV